jgi:hypothetical protein
MRFDPPAPDDETFQELRSSYLTTRPIIHQRLIFGRMVYIYAMLFVNGLRYLHS